MKELLCNSVYFGVCVSILGYMLGVYLQKRFRSPLLNPLLLSVVFVVAALLLLRVDYEAYNNGAKYLSYLLTPATVCLAVPLYEQLSLLKKDFWAILLGILAGVLASAASIFLLCCLFRLNHEQFITLLPKSVTTAIGIGISEELGGIPTLTAASIIITGIFGSMASRGICRLFRIREPAAVGLALGTASHAVGTTKALELGEVEGAMSSLAVAVAGLMTVVLAPLFAHLR